MLFLATEDVAGYLIAGAAIVTLIVLVIVYVILPLMALIALCGMCYGGYFAIANYASAFDEITIKGNQT